MALCGSPCPFLELKPEFTYAAFTHGSCNLYIEYGIIKCVSGVEKYYLRIARAQMFMAGVKCTFSGAQVYFRA